MLYHTYWRCCGHSAAGLAIGVALATAGVVGLARVAIVLDDDAGTTIKSFLPKFNRTKSDHERKNSHHSNQ